MRDGGVLRFDRRDDKIVMRNPGLLRLSPERIYNGDYTQARNGAIQKMLRMVGFGDNIGSGFTKIMNAWKGLGFPSPTIRQEDEVDEVWLTLPLPSGFPVFIASYDGVNGTDGTVNDQKKGEETSRRGEETGSKGEEISGKGGETDSRDEEISEKGEETLGQLPKDVLESLTDLQKQILRLIYQNPAISFKQLGQELGMTEKALRIQRSKMEKENIYWIREGSTKAGRWIVNINNNNH